MYRLHDFCKVSLLKPTVDKAGDSKTELTPIECGYKTVERIYKDSPLFRKCSTDSTKINFVKSIIEQCRDTCADIIKVDCVEEIVNHIKRCLNTAAQFCTDTAEVDTVYNAINLFTENRTNTRPIAVGNRLFYLVYPRSKITVELHFLKHRTVVCSAAAATAATVGKDIQFINTCGKAFCGFCCAACGFGILSLSLNGFRPSTRPGELRKQLIQHIGESNRLVNHILDCRSKSVDERSNHRPNGVFEVQKARCNSIHGRRKVTADSLTVLIYIARSFLKCVCDLRQSEPNPPVYSDTTDGANKSVELFGCTAYGTFQLAAYIFSEIFNPCK